MHNENKPCLIPTFDEVKVRPLFMRLYSSKKYTIQLTGDAEEYGVTLSMYTDLTGDSLPNGCDFDLQIEPILRDVRSIYRLVLFLMRSESAKMNNKRSLVDNIPYGSHWIDCDIYYDH